MTYALAPTFSFCNPGGQHVFLDIGRDRYFALSAPAEASFARLVAAERLSDLDRAHLATLKNEGLLVDSGDRPPPKPCSAPVALSSILDRDDLPSSSVFPTLSATARLTRAKSTIRRVPLYRLIDDFGIVKTALGVSTLPASVTTISRLAVAFKSAARLVGALDQCLALSFALARRALELHLNADLLIGVKLRPFEAHAWVQIDGTVVSDRLDAVRPYTPILAL